MCDFDAARISAQGQRDQRIRSGDRKACCGWYSTSIKGLDPPSRKPQGVRSRRVSDDRRAGRPVGRAACAGRAVILGKSTTSEFGCKAVGDSPLTGNYAPILWNTNKGRRGVKRGAAAFWLRHRAVPYAIGHGWWRLTLRIPASLCGLFRHQGNSGAFPVFPNISHANTWQHVGTAARTPQMRQRIAVIAGFDTGVIRAAFSRADLFRA